MKAGRLGACSTLLAVMLAGCGGDGQSPLYSKHDVQSAFKQAGLSVGEASIPPAYKQGLINDMTILAGGIKGNRDADVIIYVFGLAGGNAVDSFYAKQVETYSQDPAHSFASRAANVVVWGENLIPNEKGSLRAAMRDLRASRA